MHAMRGRPLTEVTSYSMCIAEAAMRMPQRGTVHSVFNAAANIVFPSNLQATHSILQATDKELLILPQRRDPYADTRSHGSFVLSLNAATTPRMPNGLQLSSPPGNFPFSALRAGMPVIFGAQRLHIEAIDCSLDLYQSPQWNPHIQRPDQLDMTVLQKNYARLKTMAEEWNHIPAPAPTDIHTLARYLCGRGIGLTPSGDDILAGWMAAGWLLYGPEPGFLNACQQIVEIARQQTHILSSCWLAHAAEGNVAEPVAELLHAMTRTDDPRLEISIKAVLSMGATSGYDLIQGILLAANIGYNR